MKATTVLCPHCGNNTPLDLDELLTRLPLEPEDVARWFLGASLVDVIKVQTRLAEQGVGLHLETATVEFEAQT